MTPIILNNQGCTTYPNGTAGDPLRAVEFRVMLRGADAPPPDSGLFRITIEPQPPPAAHDGPSGPAEPPSPPQESSGPETASAGRSGGFREMACGPELGTTAGTMTRDLDLETTFPVDGIVVNGVRYVREQPEESKPDPLEGLPPLADGSRWDGEWLIEGECEYEQPTRHCLHEYRGGDWCLMSDIEQPDVPDPPTVATLVYLLARHQRATGIARDGQSDWWADRLRKLADDLKEKDEGLAWETAADRKLEISSAARSIRAILDDLGRKGLA